MDWGNGRICTIKRYDCGKIIAIVVVLFVARPRAIWLGLKFSSSITFITFSLVFSRTTDDFSDLEDEINDIEDDLNVIIDDLKD